MRTTLNFLLVGIMIMAVAFTSCSKDGDMGTQGAQGIQGIQGPEGPQGPPGEAGADGQDGEDGNANVISSQWISVTGTDWLPSSGSVTQKIATLTAPEVTQEFIDTAVILVYVKNVFSGTQNSIVPLPMDDGANQFLIQGIDVGIIDLKARRLDLTSFSSSFIVLPFRYVIIPANVAAKGELLPDFRKMTYFEVMDYFGLEY